MGSNWSGGSGADCTGDAEAAVSAPEAATDVDAVVAGVGAEAGVGAIDVDTVAPGVGAGAADGDAAGSGGVGADE